MSSSLPPDPASPPLVLVVDDEPRNRELVRAYLGSTFRVVEAGSGTEALAVVAREPVDLVLLDVMMPEMDGFDCCQQIKQTPREGFLPVLLLTALHAQEDRIRGLSAGADDFLTKPVDRHELLLRVRVFLRLRQQEAQIRRQLLDLKTLQELKDDLFSLIVHDLRNPLTSVQGFLQVIQYKLAEPAYTALRGDVSYAREAAERLERILDDVLQVRVLEDGQLPLSPEAVELAALASEALATMDGVARAKHITVTHHARGNTEVRADRSLVRRCLENLLANALKFSPPTQVVEVTVAAENGGVVVGVADHGPGIPDALKPKVFGKYSSALPKGEGLRGFGLGLHLVKLVAEAHGGVVGVQDRAGGGSVFRLFLPRQPVLRRPPGTPPPTAG
jgi:signal transduction histidine kinase